LTKYIPLKANWLPEVKRKLRYSGYVLPHPKIVKIAKSGYPKLSFKPRRQFIFGLGFILGGESSVANKGAIIESQCMSNDIMVG